MNLVITLTTAGADTGPFNLYSDVDSFANAFDVNIDKAILLAGFATSNVPDGTLEVRVQSVNALCNNFGSAGLVELSYYFEPEIGSYLVDFIDNGSFAYTYGYFNGYFNGSSTVPGNLLSKINLDKSIDTNFDIQEGFNFGIVYIGATLFQQPDGKIILTGFYTSFNGDTAKRIIRLNTDGSRDATFNSGTGFNDYTTKIAKDSSGNLFITGIYTAYNGQSVTRLAKLLSDGTLDTSFDSGTGFNGASIDILINSDDTMYITGYFNTYNGNTANKIIKIKPDATVDTSFIITSGFNVGNLTVSMARIEGESSFYCAGYFTSFNGAAQPHIVKLDETGTPVSSLEFDAGTGFNGDVGGIKVIWTNKLLLWGGSGGVGVFTEYNGTPTPGGSLGTYIILNADGTILKTWAIGYINVYVIGFTVFGQPNTGGDNQIIYTYTP